MTHVWLDRHDRRVAEVAEALGVATDHLFASLVHRGRVLAFYSPRIDDGVEIRRATLQRDQDGLLRRVGEEIEIPNVGDVLRDPDLLYEYLE